MVRVARDAPVQLFADDDRLPMHAADPAQVAGLAERYGLRSSIVRLQKALDALPN